MARKLTKKQQTQLTEKLTGIIQKNNALQLRLSADRSVNEMNVNQISGALNRIHGQAIGKDLPTEINIPVKQLGSGDPSPDNVRPVVGYEIDGIGTVYGGDLNIDTGVLTVNSGYVELGTLDYNKGATGAFSSIRAPENIEIPASTSTAPAYLITSIYISRAATLVYNTPALYDYSIAISNNGHFIISDSRYVDRQAFTNMLTAGSIAAVYKYNSPETYTLTPEQMIQLLDQL